MTVARTARIAQLAQIGIFVLLAAIALGALSLQRAAWPTGAPETPRLLAAIALTTLYLTATIIGWRLRRRLRTTDAARDDDAAAALVIHASQTGFAQGLAELTARRLREGGLSPVLMPMASLDAARLHGTGMALFVVSTTGEGDPPDAAQGFVDEVMSTTPALDGLRYAVLALGDRRYAHYCAFGHAVEAWLRRCGAQPLFDLVDIDDGDGGGLRRWQQDLDHLPGMTAAATASDWAPAPYARWRLCARRTLNPGSLGGEVSELHLWPDGDAMSWIAGDIAEIGPQHPAEAVDIWLRDRGIDGDAEVRWCGRTLSLHEAVAQAYWPTGDIAFGIDATALAAQLKPLPHRAYSIASIPEEGHLRLLVRRMRTPEGRLGLGSGWLCDHALIGEEIALRIRRNPGFHPPSFDAPLILIGNGTGLAGLRAHLAARAAVHARGAWLIFGERQRAHDRFWGDELDAWCADGTLTRADLVFSRDEGPHRYVQDLLRDVGDAIRTRVEDGACILVCGSAAGMAPAVDEALGVILGRDRLATLRRDGRYRRDVY